MEDLSRYYTLLRDATRRKIVEILGSQEKIGFKELRETLGLGVGTVYYHLDMLSGFLAQDKQHKYRLNDRGKALYRVLKEGNVPPTVGISEAFSHRMGKWLFLCYPYFGNYTLEHDPTIGLSESPLIPSLTNQNLLMILVGATMAIAVAVAGVKLRRKPVNIVNVH
jgi:DNA-binding transcriptional ArsR family regulator